MFYFIWQVNFTTCRLQSNLLGLECTFPISFATLPRTPGRIPPGSLGALASRLFKWLLNLGNKFLWWLPWVWETKRSYKGPDLESILVATVQQCYFWQETPEFPWHYELEHCHDEAAMTLLPTVLFFSPSLSASDVARCFCSRAD